METSVLMVFLVFVCVSVLYFGQDVDAQCTVPDQFGDGHCQYQCHCRNIRDCNHINGQCAQCGKGYAGTGCQYENRAYQQPVRTNITFIGSVTHIAKAVDGDTSSCILESGNSSLPLLVSLAEPAWVNVVRVAFFSRGNSGAITSSVDDVEVDYLSGDDDNATRTTKLRHHPSAARVSDVTYHLRRPSLVSGVRIQAVANKTMALCEVSMYGGRNLAIRKNATLGEAPHLNSTGNTSAPADLAVDGHKECWQGAGGSGQAGGHLLPVHWWWAVSLGHRLTVWRVRVYHGHNSSAPAPFALNVTLNDSSEVTVFRGNGSWTANNLTDVILPEPVAAIQLTLWREDSDEVLELCEVEVIGDCQDGYFGWQCDQPCHCDDKAEVCDKVAGFCPQSGCREGYKGDDCREECDPGTFGFNCSRTCESGCAHGACHHVTGRCTNGCEPGWKGEYCDQECPSGSHGPNCSLACAASCADDVCDHVTGDCTNGCLPGKQGKKCDEDCKPGFHGRNCSLRCSDQCVNATCHTVNGHCLGGCVVGFMGNLCEKPLKGDSGDSGDLNWKVLGVVIGLAVIGAILVIIVIVWCWRRYCRIPKSDNGITGDHDLQTTSAPTPKPRTLLPYPTTTTTPATTTTTTTIPSPTTTITTPSPRPRTTKPHLASLFSRDASKVSPHPEGIEDLALGPSSCVGEERSSGSEDPCGPPQGAGAGSSSSRLLREALKGAASFESLDTVSVDNLSLTTTPPRSRRHTGDSRDSVDEVGDGDPPPSTLLPLQELPAKVAKWLENPRHFSKERSMLPTGKQHDWNVAMLPHNLGKNRYKNIFPYDHSRVLLTPLPEDPQSDFYNACYIDGYNTEREYVAAQGPMEKTLYDFLRLVWDTDCRRIVMLTKVAEMGRFKCQQYWPDEGALTSGDVTVHVQQQTVFADYTVRHLSLNRSGESRVVTMYHYTAWPDLSTPASPWSLLHFRQKVHQGATPGQGPIIVHCSAGIGRTGTYLALDLLLARALHEREVDVFRCVTHLRQQRINMVQTLAQYIFVHEALRAFVLSSHPVPAGEFTLDRLLLEQDGVRPIDDEYERLQMCLGPVSTGDTEDPTPPELVGLPRDIHRVNIFGVEDGTWRSAYINAVFLSNCKRAEAYIQTHSPTDPGAAIHFLSMLIQYHVTCVVNLDTEQDETFEYWPDTTNTSLNLGPYTVTLLSMRKAQGIMVRTLRVSFPAHLGTNESTAEAEGVASQEVTQVTCSAWCPSRPTPSSVSVILDIAGHMASHYDHPVVVHCRDGHTRSGLVIVAAAVLEELRTEGHVAVNYVTAHMRVPRRENIVSVEQYEFLYACAQHQLNPERGGDVTGSEKADDHLYVNVDSGWKRMTETETNPTEEEPGSGNSDARPKKREGGEGSSGTGENVYSNVDVLKGDNVAQEDQDIGDRDPPPSDKPGSGDSGAELKAEERNREGSSEAGEDVYSNVDVLKPDDNARKGPEVDERDSSSSDKGENLYGNV